MKLIRPKKLHIKKLNKSQLLKKEINSKELSFLMEAHNGLTAKIVEQSGFKGIWGSGERFVVYRPNSNSANKEKLIWRGLLGAAPFLAIITNLKLLIYPIEPLLIWEA